MAFVYSTQFARGSSSSSGPVSLYTVPSGMVAVIRDVTVFASSAGSGALFAISAAETFYSTGAIPALNTVHFSGRVVLNAGEVLDLYVTAGTVQYVVSGYLLAA